MLGLGIVIPDPNLVDYDCGIVVGCTHQGGIIFWLDGSGGGLIAAPADETASTWGCMGDVVPGADGTAIGTGAQNTIDINAECLTADTAADKCRDKSLGGYTDWFLPSKDELNQMYLNLHLNTLGGFVNSYYWSSSEKTSTSAWCQRFDTGFQAAGAKLTSFHVRAIREF